MLIANYHTHTTLCRHAKGDMREYVENAVKAGIKELGFSDHAPQIFPEEWGYYSTFRMFPEQTAQYVESVRELAKEYAVPVQVLSSFRPGPGTLVTDVQDALLPVPVQDIPEG